MQELKDTLLNSARMRYKEIRPCGTDWDSCFTVEDDLLLFWFNTADDSTHVLSIRIS